MTAKKKSANGRSTAKLALKPPKTATARAVAPVVAALEVRQFDASLYVPVPKMSVSTGLSA